LTATPEDSGLVHFDDDEVSIYHLYQALFVMAVKQEAALAGSISKRAQPSTTMPPINHVPETGELVKVGNDSITLVTLFRG